MAKQFLLIIGFLFSIQVMSQTGIGITTPDPSAKLHVSATDKGFLPPRIALTAINSATPITSPANGLMVFNTATAGVNPYQVVPGYYYWDGTGQQWVSLSTTVGNVQNQAIFRSTSSTTGTSVVTSWNSRFNNIANGDLTFSSNTTFALSNGIYKIQWGLPHQSTQTYNMMQLQENISGSWGAWLNDPNFANVANGGNTDWGGTSFMTDVIDCSSSTRTLRFTNPDGRTLLTGASFIITKLNPAITTSTTADNFGNHTATKNLLLNGNYLSNDGGNEGIRVDNSGNVGIGTASPAVPLEVNGAVNASTLSLSNSTNGTSSLVLRNGDAATAFTDAPQIRMGWSGSAAGKSQYAQIIHSRHNSGGTNNAIDFYLSNGTADNTIISGSTRAMTITSPGNVEITGKLSVGDPTGNVVSKASGLVDAGTFVQLDNIKATVIRNGNYGGLSLASVAGSFNCNIGGNFSGPAVGNSGTAGTTTITTTASTSIFGWGFPSQGDTSTYILTDTTNSRAYRITLQIGGSFLNNFISIERLF